MKNLTYLLLKAGIVIYLGAAQADPVPYNLGGLMEGSVEAIPEIPADCPPLVPCPRTRRTTIVFPKPTGSFAFPDVCQTPTPAGPVPIPYINIGLGSRIELIKQPFTTPGGDSADVEVTATAQSEDLVALDVVVVSESGYMLSSLIFGGVDTEGNPVEYTLVLNAQSVDAMVTNSGLAVLAGF